MHAHLRTGYDAGELRFLEIGVDIKLVHRHQRSQTLADRHQIAILYREIANNAVIRRLQNREGQIAGRLVAGQLQRTDGAFRLLTLGAQELHIGLGRGDGGIAGHNIRLGLIERDLRIIGRGNRADILCLQLACALLGDFRTTKGCIQRALLGNGLLERRFAADDLRIDTLQRQFLGADLRFGLVERDTIIAVVKRHQRVARLDFLVLDHVHPGDVTGNLRRDDRDVTFDIGVVRRH